MSAEERLVAEAKAMVKRFEAVGITYADLPAAIMMVIALEQLGTGEFREK